MHILIVHVILKLSITRSVYCFKMKVFCIIIKSISSIKQFIENISNVGRLGYFLFSTNQTNLQSSSCFRVKKGLNSNVYRPVNLSQIEIFFNNIRFFTRRCQQYRLTRKNFSKALEDDTVRYFKAHMLSKYLLLHHHITYVLLEIVIKISNTFRKIKFFC